MPPKKGPRRGPDAADTRLTEPPVPFCEVEAPGASPCGSHAALARCLICCQDQPRFAAVGRCGHVEVCWLCAVRLRALLRDFHCPVCKEELPEVTLTDTPWKLGGRAPASRDEELGIVYAKPEVRAEVERVFDYTCWQRGCSYSFDTLGALERHVREEHGRHFCRTCLRDRKVFLFEQALYSPDDLDRHHRQGDAPQVIGRALPPTPPHVQCNFCRRSFYSQDELLLHMHKRHHLCTLCERQGRRGEYYRDSAYLSLHYEEQHYVCTHEDCRRDNFRMVAFASEDELRMHEHAEHSAAGGKAGQKSKKRGVRINLQIGATPYREERRQVGQGAGHADAAEDAWAARANNGDVQVRFMWTRGQADGAAGGGDARDVEDEEEGQRYPPRRSATGPRPRRAAAAAANTARAAAATAPAPEDGTPPPTSPSSSAASSRPTSSWRGRGARGGEDAVSVSSGSSSVSRGATQPGAGAAQPGAGAAQPGAGTAEQGTLVSRSAAERGVLAQLLGAALSQVQRTGLDSATELEAEEYRDRNRRFRTELQEAFGAERLSQFKHYSASFRQATAKAADAPGAAEAVKGYAEHVLEVFSAAQRNVGQATTAKLLSELVVLLPDQALRHALQQQLVGLRNMLVKAQAEPQAASQARSSGAQGTVRGGVAAAQQRGPATQRPDTPVATPTSRAGVTSVAANTAEVRADNAVAATAKVGGTAAASGRSATLPPALEVMPASEAFWERDDRTPSFLLALDAVLAALAQHEDQPERPAVAKEPALVSQIKSLDCHKMESLDAMQQHLSAAGAGHLDFSTLERVLALRPQLSLKLQARQQGAEPPAAAWREWKVAAAAAIRTLGVEERRCVRSYVRLCLRRRTGAPPQEPRQDSGVAEAFPSIQAANRQAQPPPQDLVTPQGSCLGFEDEPPGSRGKRKGKQRPLLVAWG